MPKDNDSLEKLPIRRYPDLERMHADLHSVIDKYRNMGIPRSAVIGLLFMVMVSLEKEE